MLMRCQQYFVIISLRDEILLTTRAERRKYWHRISTPPYVANPSPATDLNTLSTTPFYLKKVIYFLNFQSIGFEYANYFWVGRVSREINGHLQVYAGLVWARNESKDTCRLVGSRKVHGLPPSQPRHHRSHYYLTVRRTGLKASCL